MEVEGRFIDARQNGAVARLVIDSVPEPIIPADGATLETRSTKAGLSRFLGQTTLKSNITGRTFRRNLAPCDAVTHPAQFSGLDVLAILTIDLDRGMYSLDRDGVMAGAQVVYGSTGSLYVASRRYVRALELGGEAPEGLRTEIHRFDVTDPTKTVYRATGTVPGFILNNYALSEHNGDLRVASTEEAPWTARRAPSRVSVLRQDGARLVQVGAVTGLGEEGERIYGVRFMGERGYVVTFRQTDPLYTLDLSQPDRAEGRRPAEDPRLLGLPAPDRRGPAARHRARGRRGQGVAVRRLEPGRADRGREAAVRQRLQLGRRASRTRSCTGRRRTSPCCRCRPTSRTSPARSACGSTPNALTEAGRIVHHSAARDEDAAVERSLVIGEKLYTLSWLGLSSSNLDNLGQLGFTAFQ